MTLPLIHAMAHAGDAMRARLRGVVEQGDAGALDEVVGAIRASGGLDYRIARAREYAALAAAALDGLADGEAVAPLRGLVRRPVRRRAWARGLSTASRP